MPSTESAAWNLSNKQGLYWHHCYCVHQEDVHQNTATAMSEKKIFLSSAMATFLAGFQCLKHLNLLNKHSFELQP